MVTKESKDQRAKQENPEQSQKFIETAKKVQAKQSQKKFNGVLGKISNTK